MTGVSPDLDRLRSLAEDAQWIAPGPIDGPVVPVADWFSYASLFKTFQRDTAQFIEAASPAVVLALVDRVRVLEAVAEAARELDAAVISEQRARIAGHLTSHHATAVSARSIVLESALAVLGGGCSWRRPTGGIS